MVESPGFGGAGTRPGKMVCSGCGREIPGSEPYPFRCPGAGTGDGIDHLLTPVHDLEALRTERDWTEFFLREEPNPFLRYRELFHSYRVGRAHGLSDSDYVEIVTGLDEAVVGVDGLGFRVTPFGREEELGQGLGFTGDGALWVKNETGNVSGSHKGRHLMGIMIWLEVVGRLGWTRDDVGTPPLAIASCGNAALAASVVARAAGRPLDVYVPPHADPTVVELLRRNQARLTPCPRDPEVSGDPCYHRFRDAVEKGALPFTVQGNENGLTLEGGETLGYEMISALTREGGELDRTVIQVGGGALASSTLRAFARAKALGVVSRLPRFHAVQTGGAAPLRRAYDRVAARVLARARDEKAKVYPGTLDGNEAPSGKCDDLERDAARAAWIQTHASEARVHQEMRYARTHRAEFMWPWEEEPTSIATGILDDETYDWAALVETMLATGGFPVTVSEEDLRKAVESGVGATGISVDPTGAAGLAGLLRLRRAGQISRDETTAVLFTGTKRTGERKP